MHLNDILESKDDPTFRILNGTASQGRWSIDVEDGCDDDLDPEMMGGMNLDGPEDHLDRLIDISLEKIHFLQTAHKKDELKRVLVVNTLHKLLLNKMDFLQSELALEASSQMQDTESEAEPRILPKQEAASILNKILQEKIGYLGYNRTVKIWVEPPKNGNQTATISLPQRNPRKSKTPPSGKEECMPESNSAAPSDREPAAF